MISYFLALLFLSAWCAAAYRIGRWYSRGIEAVFLGLGIVGTISFLVFITCGVSIAVALALVAAAIVAGRPRSLRSCIRGACLEPSGPVALATLALVLGFAFAATPCVFIDTLHYHVGLPWQYAVEGVIAPQYHDAVGGFPQLNEMLLLPAIVVLPEPRIAGIFNMLLLALFSAAWLRRGAASSRTWAWLLTLTTPLLIQSAVLGKNDVLVLLFVAFAFRRMERFTRRGMRRDLLLGATFCGFALATKYTSHLFLAALALGIAAAAFRRSGARAAVGSAAAFIAAAWLVLAPWLLKNALTYGNPFHPFRAGPFGSAAGLLDPKGFDVVAGFSWQRFALEFPRLVITGAGSKPITNVAGFQYLAGVLLACAFRRRLRAFAPHLVFLAAVIPLWSITNSHPRYILPVFLVMNMVTAGLLETLRGAARRAASIALLVLTVGNVLYAASEEEVVFHRFEVLSGAVAPDRYLAEFVPIPFVASRIPPGDHGRVLLVGETQRAYFRNPLLVTGDAERNPLEDVLASTSDPRAARSRLREMDISYIYIDRAWWDLFRAGHGYMNLDAVLRARFEGLIREQCDAVFASPDGRISLYRLRAGF